MAFDQTINYKVNVDDSGFQAKLTQMRASVDNAMGAGGGGMSSTMMYGMMGAMQGGGGGGMGLGGGMADFGSQIRPVTYTPPAIAMQPHFGMVAINQTLAQAGLATVGGMFGSPMFGAGLSGALTNFQRGGLGEVLRGRDAIPNNISVAEYMNMSNRQFGAALGDTAAVAGVSVAGTAAGLAATTIAGSAGAALFSSGIGKLIGGTVFGAAGGALVGQYVGAVTDQMADNRAIQTSLANGSFRFFNDGGMDTDRPTGRGMSLNARQRVANYIQDQSLNDTRFGAGEYQQILEGGMQMDAFSGTHDVEDFKNKFKGLVENLKTVTSTLHTSLKEGIEVIRGFRDMGVTEPGDVNRLTLSSEARGRVSGRTGMEMIAIGQTGAEMFRGTGIDMNRGFELNQLNTMGVRNMLNQGTLSRESVAQAGGENALGQQMTANNLASFQTPFGRAAMMANFNPATGGLNPNMMNNLMSGNTMQQISGAASQNAAGLLTFQARQEELISSMSPEQMQMFGIETRTGMARMYQSAAPGLKFEDAYRVSGQRMGMSKSLIDADIAMMHQDPEQMKASQQRAVDAMRDQAGLEDLRNRFNPMTQVGNFLSRNTVTPVARFFTGIAGSVEQGIENLGMRARGIAVTDSSILGGSNVAEGDALRARAGGGVGILVDTQGSAYQRLIGGQNTDAFRDQLVSDGTYNAKDSTISYRGATARVFADRDAAAAYAEKNKVAMSFLGDSGVGPKGSVIAIENSEMAKATERARGMQFTSEEAKSADKVQLSSEIAKGIIAAGNDAGYADVVKIISQGKYSAKDLETMSDEEFKHATGKSKGESSALVKRYIDKYSNSDSAAAKGYAKAADTTIGTNGLAQSRARILERGNAERNILNQGILDATYSMTDDTLGRSDGSKISISDALKQDQNLSMLIYGGSINDAKLALKDKGYRDVDNIVDALRGKESTAVHDKRQQSVNMIKEIASLANDAGKSATGAKEGAVVTGSTIGDVSKDTMAEIQRMSNNLETSYKTLIALQKNLNDLVEKGKK